MSEKSPIEKLFGKKPEKGNDFKYTDLEVFKNKENEVAILSWGAAGVGFGEITLRKRDEEWWIDSEFMNDEFVLDAFTDFIKKCKNDNDLCNMRNGIFSNIRLGDPLNVKEYKKKLINDKIVKEGEDSEFYFDRAIKELADTEDITLKDDIMTCHGETLEYWLNAEKKKKEKKK